MLVNDSSTIVCELPVWFWDKNMDLGVCGHVDILQIRQGRIYVLDFKPNAENGRRFVYTYYSPIKLSNLKLKCVME